MRTTSTPSASSIAMLVEALRQIVGSGNVLLGDDMAPALVDWRGRYRGAAQCLVRPGSTAEVAAVVRCCRDAGVPIVPQGGNTSLCGGSIPDASGTAVVVSLQRMNRLRAIDPENNTLTAEAGCVLSTVQQAARDAGRLFPLSLAAEGSAQLGGNLSTNAGGVQVLRYGNTRELTLGLEVVLPSGEIWDGLRGLRKDNTGYDLKHLFIGAEGTLGIITAATMKLFPLPTAVATAWVAIDSPQQAITLLTALQSEFGPQLTACELVSEISLGLVLQHIPATARPLEVSPWYVLVELSSGGDDADLGAWLEAYLASAIEKRLCTDAVLAQSKAQAQRLWALRENISEAQKIEGLSIKHDVSLPISRLAGFIACADAVLATAYPGLRVVTFGHVGDGNLHYNLSMPASSDNAALIAAQPEVNRIVHDLVHENGGSISAEHGVGQLKREEILRYKSPVEMDMMRAVKQALDPLGLMNPGKVL
ncbi:MAG: FAD-binding oxidoreductase [Zoogloeaceae bacterium]|nr:FAD-binding oxidoreductase [Zoogloeaceae bacterium]